MRERCRALVARGRDRTEGNARRQRGFTLVELMVALLVSSLLVGMILAIFTRMSLAYRGQQQVAGVQQVLAAARATFELDAKQAGLAMTNGFKIVTDGPGTLHSPVVQINSNTGPDQIAFYYADTTAQGMVNGGAWPVAVSLDHSPGPTEFQINDLVVLSTYDNSTPGLGGPPAANLASFDACVLQVADVSGNTVTFSQVPPWGNATQTHCTVPVVNKTMLYKFVAHAYRIDNSTPARAAMGPLQQSPTGALMAGYENWTDLAYGFTDIQTAMQFYDLDGIDTNDPDTDPARDWYSEGSQSAFTAPQASFAAEVPLQISISLVARTDRDVEGIATSATPNLIVPAIPDNNTIGDHPSVALPSATDDLLKGNRIYRYTTFQVDLRNLGVGR